MYYHNLWQEGVAAPQGLPVKKKILILWAFASGYLWGCRVEAWGEANTGDGPRAPLKPTLLSFTSVAIRSANSLGLWGIGNVRRQLCLKFAAFNFRDVLCFLCSPCRLAP